MLSPFIAFPILLCVDPAPHQGLGGPASTYCTSPTGVLPRLTRFRREHSELLPVLRSPHGPPLPSVWNAVLSTHPALPTPQPFGLGLKAPDAWSKSSLLGPVAPGSPHSTLMAVPMVYNQKQVSVHLPQPEL